MIDPPREEAKQAIKTCFNAGIVPVMITGDHIDTAVAIADKLEIFDSKIDKSKQILTGNELNYLSDNELESIIENIRVYARVSPEHKMRIVNAWKKKNKIVAMTGDGVNDAPAIKFADIGIGMGITGTDVTKNVSDIVLADDNFATIVSAIKEGRKIYDNIKKTIQFLLSSNIGEVVTLFFGTILNWNVLYPIHILWVNLVTDSLPALSLGMEKEDKDIMTRTPKKVKESIFDGNMGFSILYQGTIKGIITLIVYFIGHKLYGQSIAVTMTFLTLSLIQLTHSYNARSNTESLFSIGIFSNKYLNISVIITILLQLIVILIPSLREIFKITYINFEQWLIVIFASLSIIPIVELVKFFTRNNKTKI
ncbi:cation-translocating P-type ATPase [Caldicellulosiruptoraceae bacterium PP1]